MTETVQSRVQPRRTGGAPIARLNNVSKMYHLGLTRSSLPQVARAAARRLLGRDAALDGPVHWALKGIDLELHRGQNLALVVPTARAKRRS